ncbi:hypothetical protein ACFLX1_00255 [Chloroflexota bacterium]
MGYKVKVQEPKQRSKKSRLTRLYGTGKESKGEAYSTRTSAEKRVKALRQDYPTKGGFEISIVRTRDYSF